MSRFTPKAQKAWDGIPGEVKQRIVANVYCGGCKGETVIVNFTGKLSRGDLILEGECKECRGPVARLIEGKGAEPPLLSVLDLPKRAAVSLEDGGYPFACAAKAGDLITVSAQGGTDDVGAVVGRGDVVAQLGQAYANVADILAAFEAAPDTIVDETWLVTDIEDVQAKLDLLAEVREQILGVPASEVSHSMMQVAALTDPAMLIAVKCIARL